MSIVEDILIPTAALGGAGATIDFYLGSAGQKRVKAWLEEKWYRFHDVNWHNFTGREAEAYVDFVDRIFGPSLFSWRRVIVSFLIVSLSTVILVGNIFYLDHQEAWNTPALRDNRFFLVVTFLIDVCSCAISISLTRSISLSVIKLARVFPSAWLFMFLVTAHYALLVVWRPIIDLILDALKLTLTKPDVAGDVLSWDYVVSRFDVIAVTPKAIFEEYYRSIINKNDALWGRLYILQWPTFLATARAALISLIVNGIRLVFALVLLISFVSRAWFGPIISTTWARLVESEKPIFTMVFGAVGAIATSLKEIIKLL